MGKKLEQKQTEHAIKIVKKIKYTNRAIFIFKAVLAGLVGLGYFYPSLLIIGYIITLLNVILHVFTLECLKIAKDRIDQFDVIKVISSNRKDRVTTNTIGNVMLAAAFALASQFSFYGLLAAAGWTITSYYYNETVDLFYNKAKEYPATKKYIDALSEFKIVYREFKKMKSVKEDKVDDVE